MHANVREWSWHWFCCKLLYYIVFSTKHHEPMTTPALREELYPYIAGIVRGQDGLLLEIGGMADHLHIVVQFGPDVSVSAIVRPRLNRRFPVPISWGAGQTIFQKLARGAEPPVR
jgi:REP element-mobilizing transposase RayT